MRGAPVHGACDTQPPQSCGTNGLCDGDGHCAVYDANTVCGDASKAREKLGWEPTVTLKEMLAEMVEADLARHRSRLG